MNAADVLSALGAHEPASGDTIAAVATGGPIEVGLARAGADQALRSAWRERSGGRATPVLVIHDSSSGSGMVRVLGPSDDRSPIREVSADQLFDLVSHSGLFRDAPHGNAAGAS